MPDYKKKNVKRAGKKRSSAQKIDDISMRSKTIRRSEAEKKKQQAQLDELEELRKKVALLEKNNNEG